MLAKTRESTQFVYTCDESLVPASETSEWKPISSQYFKLEYQATETRLSNSKTKNCVPDVCSTHAINLRSCSCQQHKKMVKR